MSDHYYSAQPTGPRDIREHAVQIGGLDLRFFTDAGVFSKAGLDEGTRLIINTLPKLCGRVLDLGCGWGALGVTLAKLNPDAEFVLSDINRRAVELAERNARENGALNARVCWGDGFQNIEGQFSFIVTNPPIRAGKAVIYPLFSEAYRRLLPGGALYMVIRKQQGAPSAIKFLSGLTGDVKCVERDKGYWIIRCGKEEHA